MVPWPARRRRLASYYGLPESELFAHIDAAQDYLRRVGGEAGPLETDPERRRKG
jgi:hypothetical protein